MRNVFVFNEHNSCLQSCHWHITDVTHAKIPQNLMCKMSLLSSKLAICKQDTIHIIHQHVWMVVQTFGYIIVFQYFNVKSSYSPVINCSRKNPIDLLQLYIHLCKCNKPGNRLQTQIITCA